MLAGCFGGNDGADEPTPTSSSTPTTQPPVDVCRGASPPASCFAPPENNTPAFRRVEFQGCTSVFLIFAVADTAKVQALMGPGYAISRVGPVTTIGLDSFLCPTVVIDNTTVLHDLHWYAVEFVANPPDEVRADEWDNGYAIEMCLNLADLRAIFEWAGFQVCDGDVELTTSGQTLTMRYFQGGALTYDYTGAGELGNGSDPRFTETLRIHQGFSTHRAWYDQQSEYYLANYGENGLLTTHGGVLQAVKAHPTDTSAAHTGIGRYDMVIEFHLPVSHPMSV